MEKIIIEEDKILEFISKNDRKKVARLSNYKDLIERLLSIEISLNAIYEFILENDKEIGNRANFYKYVKNNFVTSKNKNKPKPTTEPKTENKAEHKPEPKTEKPTTVCPPKNATSILSQNFDLLAFPEQ